MRAESLRPPRPGDRPMPMLWRIFFGNAAVLAVATLALVLSPATVSFPVAAREAVVLAGGLAVMLVIDYLVLRRVVAPLDRLTVVMRDIDPLAPGRRSGLDDETGEVGALARAFDEMLERLEVERRESARRALAAQEDERRRIARELHDEVGQSLTAAVLHIARAQTRATDESECELADARDAVRATLDEVRAIAANLRPEALDDLGLGSALAALSLEMSRRTGLRIDRRVGRSLPALSSEEELVVYRVAQEALTNVARHSRARAARVEVAPHDGRVELTVRDEGCGFDRDGTRDGTGLRAMRERALLVGASLTIDSVEGEGTTVRLRLDPVQSR
jgi:two-component system, NarL family, sensor histidine kinase UhpB